MKTLSIFLGLILCATSTSATSNEDFRTPATPCNETVCQLPDCHCASTTIPGGLIAAETPQLVLLTFDDAVGRINIDYYREAMRGRKNPNDCSISSAYFITHHYTDYSLIHELHSEGHEIAMHSISHESNTNYWKDATVETLTFEFAKQRNITSVLANIPRDDIKGTRLPFLQMSGNNHYQMMKENNFTYDSSWFTQSFMQPGLWPYTLDYLSTQDCLIPPCPTDSFPGIWIIPMISWMDNNGIICAMPDACVGIPDTAEGIVEWMKKEFNRQYQGNKAPFGLYLHADWFGVNSVHFEAYKLFLDYLGTLNDVYIVSPAQVIDWVRSPKTISQMNTFPCSDTHPIQCVPKTCEFNYGSYTRWITSCIPECPSLESRYGNLD